jgi:hypothetical protein
MNPASRISALGFRRWYERELIKSHAALVTSFMCAVLVAALAEQLNFARSGWPKASVLLVVLAALAIACVSARSYFVLMHRAERYGARSTCAVCHEYGRFTVVESGGSREALPEDDWMKVQCRKCGHGWRMPE